MAENGLSGLWRINSPRSVPTHVGLSGNVGYGYTEGHSAAPGDHHQWLGRVSLSGRPVEWLGVSGSTRLRHDRHEDDPAGSDEGTSVDSSLTLLAGQAVSPFVSLGARLQARFSEAGGLERSLSNPAVEVAFLASYRAPRSPYEWLGTIGYRLDATGNTVEGVARYRSGDLLALGVSEFDAIPLAAGVRYRWESNSFLFAELGGDWLLGEGAPDAALFPWRATVGASTLLHERLSGAVIADTSLSGRRAADSPAGVFVAEPRFRLLAALSMSWSTGAASDVPRPPSTINTPPPELEPKAVPTSVLIVQVTSPEGDPLSDANVRFKRGEEIVEIPHQNLESYRLEGIEQGTLTLLVSGARLKPVSQEVELTEAQVVVPIQLQAAGLTGQIRGVVRSFSGKGLMTRIRIEPLGEKRVSSADGSFTIDVPPGRYEVVLEAEGHMPQRRKVEVTADGVVVLNADLRRGLP